MISVNKLSIQFAGRSLFSDVSFIVNKKDRIGLVGKNGAGKTTLMRLFAGLIAPTSGEIATPSQCLIGYLPQEMQFAVSETVLKEALKAFIETRNLEARIEELTSALSKRTDYESPLYHSLSQELAEANERYHILDGATQVSRTEKVLLGLGFSRNDLDKPLSVFSGGWQMRVQLAKILLQEPDFILLDEPTNHLDIESIQWLEGFLSDYPGAVMLVSHDRSFLDNVTTRTIELSMGKAYDYKACYSDYEMMRQDRLQHELSAFGNQQRQIAQIERFITRFRAKNTKASQVQSRIKLLDKMEKVEVEQLDNSSIHFRFPQAPASGKVTIEAHMLSKSYGEKEVLKNLDFMVARGERIAFVGRNGEGKTTLSRIITREIEHEGKLILGHNVSIGYYAQNQSEFLDPSKTVFQTLDDAATGDIRIHVRNILGGFLFSGDDTDKKVSVLSGGEKSRLAIARLLLSPVNLLVLDEPTNHLDMRSKDILKNALLQYSGTLIVVSHDRDFLQGLTNKVFEFRDKAIRIHQGDVYSFIESRKLENLRELEKKKAVLPGSGEDNTENTGRNSWENQKQLGREIRKAENMISTAEQTITRLESLLHEMETLMASSIDEQSDPDIFSRYEKTRMELHEAESAWEEAHRQLELLKSGQQTP